MTIVTDCPVDSAPAHELRVTPNAEAVHRTAPPEAVMVSRPTRVPLRSRVAGKTWGLPRRVTGGRGEGADTAEPGTGTAEAVRRGDTWRRRTAGDEDAGSGTAGTAGGAMASTGGPEGDGCIVIATMMLVMSAAVETSSPAAVAVPWRVQCRGSLLSVPKRMAAQLRGDRRVGRRACRGLPA
jgi:hypothetical protein